ncbi:MAG: hypothetical protein GC160_15170 [Acidobacteria bacterium]|nr:hypothetical protein [Acidobacteriota bacterium]
MGLTVESVLVQRTGPDSLAALADAVRRALGEDFEELAPGAKADRTIVLAADPASAWTAVLDTQFGEAKKLAAALSREAGALALAVGVFDSDDAWLRLCRDGKALDTLSLRGKTPRGRPERWAPALPPPLTPHEWFEQLTGETVFVEDRVSRAAELLGAAPAQCLTRADEWEASCGPSLRLSFRSRLLPQKREAEGPPSFELHDRFAGVEAGVGDALQQLAVSVRNKGGESRGVEVRLEGDAVERGLLAAESVTLVRFLERQTTERLNASFVGGVAHLEEMLVPAGPPDLGLELLGKMMLADQTLFTKGKLWANLALKAARPGEGLLRVRVLPLANPSAEAVWEAPVRVVEAIRKPLRSAEPGSLYARKLATPRTLFGLAVLDGDQASAAPAAGRAIRAWLDALGAGEGRWRLHWDFLRPDAPRDTLIAASKPPADKALTKALERLADHETLLASRFPDKEERQSGAGFVFDVGASQFSVATAAPHIGLWADLQGRDAHEQERLRQRLTETFDALAAENPLLQAFVARWDCADGVSADHTLYELACGIVGQCVKGRPWCERWLRAATETMWLGPSLLDRVSGLERVAAVEPRGQAVRLTLRPDASLDALEQTLAPLLPSLDDWRRGVQQLYGRG